MITPRTPATPRTPSTGTRKKSTKKFQTNKRKDAKASVTEKVNGLHSLEATTTIVNKVMKVPNHLILLLKTMLNINVH